MTTFDLIGSSFLKQPEEEKPFSLLRPEEEKPVAKGIKRINKKAPPTSKENMKNVSTKRSQGAKTMSDRMHEETLNQAKKAVGSERKLREVQTNQDNFETMLDKLAELPGKTLTSKQGLQVAQKLDPNMTQENFVNKMVPTIQNRREAIKELNNMAIGTQLSKEDRERYKQIGISKPGKHMSVLKLMTNLVGGVGQAVGEGLERAGAADLKTGRKTLLGGPGMKLLEREQSAKEKFQQTLAMQKGDQQFEQSKMLEDIRQADRLELQLLKGSAAGSTDMIPKWGIVDGKSQLFFAGKDGKNRRSDGSVINGIVKPISDIKVRENKDTKQYEFLDVSNNQWIPIGSRVTEEPSQETLNFENIKLDTPAKRESYNKVNERVSNDPIVKKYQGVASAISEFRALVEEDNPASVGVVQRKLLEIAGEERYTDQDLKAATGNQAIPALFNQVIEKGLTGKITPENQKLFVQMANLMEDIARKQVGSRTKFHYGGLRKGSTISGKEVDVLRDHSIVSRIYGIDHKPSEIKKVVDKTNTKDKEGVKRTIYRQLALGRTIEQIENVFEKAGLFSGGE